jgi:hypothetical protein
MATGTIMPAPVFTGLDSNGDPVAGGLLYTYEAGTTTPATTYSDVALTVAHANPVVLDSAGRATVFLTPGNSYKFLLKTAAASTVWTADNISTVPTSASSLDVDGVAGTTITAGQVVYLSDGSGSTTAGRWYLADADNTYSSSAALAIGVALSNLTAGDTGSIRLGGLLAENLSGLSAGTLYYVSATAGALTATAPANARLVGAAQTTTSLVLTPPPAALHAATLTTGTVPTARLGSGTANSSAYLRGDSTWASFSSATAAYTTSGSGTITLSSSNGALQFVNCTGTATVNLYATSGTAGYIVHVKLTGSGATVTLDGNASETIDGATTQAFTQQYQCLSLLSTGSAWLII